MNTHLTEEELILHFYSETERGEEARIDSHLASCAECQAARQQLVNVMTLVDSATPVEASIGFERTAWARLEPQLEAVQDDSPVRRSVRKVYDVVFGRTAREGGWFPQWALAGGVAALVFAAFIGGRVSSVAPVTMPYEAVAKLDPDRVLHATVGDHLDRTQMMLVELVNAEAGHADVLAGEQPRAADLVAANRLLRVSAQQSGDAAIVDLLDDLERVLMEIANAPANASSNELTDLQSRITTQDLLFRLRVIASEMRQRTTDREAGDPTARRMPRS